jgi:hypothetical protein
MRRIGKFLALPFREKLLLLWTIFLLAAIRIGFILLPFKALRRLLSRLARAGRAVKTVARQSDVDRIVWALSTAGRAFPTVGTCLTQALAGYLLLGRKGYRTDLRIGVTRDAKGKFLAHAWLEKEGVVVVGQIGASQKRYTPLPALRDLEPFQ